MKKVFTHRLLRGVDLLFGAMWLMLLAALTQGVLAVPGLNLPQDPEFPSQSYDTQIDYEEITPQTWRSIYLEMRKADGSIATVDLLRPLWWLEATQAEIGGSIYLSLPELGLEGDAAVRSIGPCEVDSRTTNPGQRVVTGKFIHQNARVLDLHFSDRSDDPLGVTSNHPIWSATHSSWVEAGHLQVGEQVRTRGGIAQLTMRSERPGRHQVFNLEVHRDHTYFVSHLSVLAHNTYPDTPNLRRGDTDIDGLEHNVWKTPDGKEMDLMLKSRVENGKLIIEDAHIMPASGTYDESRRTLGRSGLKQLARDLGEKFGVNQIEIPGSIGRGQSGAKGSFGNVSIAVNNGNVKISRLKN